MRWSWRSYCPGCWLWIRGSWWTKQDDNIDGLYAFYCPNCETVVEKYNTLDENGFGRTVRLQ